MARIGVCCKNHRCRDSMPGEQTIEMKRGQTMFWNGKTIHRGVAPEGLHERMSLHGGMAQYREDRPTRKWTNVLDGCYPLIFAKVCPQRCNSTTIAGGLCSRSEAWAVGVITVAEDPLEPLAYEGVAAPIADIQPRPLFWASDFSLRRTRSALLGIYRMGQVTSDTAAPERR